MGVTHKPKSGVTLTGTEYEAADSHVVAIAHTDLSSVSANQHHNQSHTQSDHTGTGATSTQAFGDAAADGTGTKPANIDHKHGMPSNPFVLGTSPSTQAFGDVAAGGSATDAAKTDHKHGMPANPVAYAAPSLTLGTSNVQGVAASAVRTDATILAFDATTPANIGTAATGAQAVAARRDHVHATGAGTPSTSAMGDAATTGSGPAAAMTDHKHARATATNKLFLPAGYAKLDSATAANIGASPDLTGVVAYADAATQGAIWTFMVPADWVSGVITLQPVWSPGSTDASAHTVRWSFTAKTVAAGTTVTAAGTTTAWTGASAARTVGVVVYDTATSTTLTPAVAGDLFRFTLQRIGADVNDTYVGVVNCLGVIVSYTANT